MLLTKEVSMQGNSRVDACMLCRSVVSDSETPWTVACQAPLLMEFSRQEYWSGVPFPTPVDLPDPGIEPASPVSPALAGRFFTTEPSGKPHYKIKSRLKLKKKSCKVLEVLMKIRSLCDNSYVCIGFFG